MSHLLSFKVMRLSRPEFYKRSPLALDKQIDLPEPGLDLSANFEDELGLSHLLSLPDSFGNIYIGEMFTALLCVNNESTTPALDISFKAELQTETQRITLWSSSAPNSRRNSATEMDKSSLLPLQNCEFVVKHKLMELGTQILVCSVHYTPSPAMANADRERKFFRKFYKFKVLNPLPVKTKVNTLPNGSIVLEAQVHNQTTASINLTSVKFDVNPLFMYESLNYDNSSDPIFASALMEANDVRNYLYLLTSNNKLDFETKSTPNIGKLEISWMTAFGETGKLHTAQLSRKVPNIDLFDVNVVKIPTVYVERPFKLTLSISNNLGERILPSIKFIDQKMPNVLTCGPSDIQLGVIDALGLIEFELEFIALSYGSQVISGVVITDKISGFSKEVENLAMVQVQQ
jgi:hypothetical protein